MNRNCSDKRPVTSATRRCELPASRQLQYRVDNTAHLHDRVSPLPGVNHNRKGCLEIGQTSKPGAAQRRTVMALKVELKPNERIIIGACMITNTDQRVRLHDTWHAEREEDVSGIPTRRPRAA
jgi:Flagellar protein FlbT